MPLVYGYGRSYSLVEMAFRMWQLGGKLLMSILTFYRVSYTPESSSFPPSSCEKGLSLPNHVRILHPYFTIFTLFYHVVHHSYIHTFVLCMEKYVQLMPPHPLSFLPPWESQGGDPVTRLESAWNTRLILVSHPKSLRKRGTCFPNPRKTDVFT